MTESLAPIKLAVSSHVHLVGPFALPRAVNESARRRWCHTFLRCAAESFAGRFLTTVFGHLTTGLGSVLVGNLPAD